MVNAEPILLANEAELTALNPFQDYGKLNFVEASFFWWKMLLMICAGLHVSFRLSLLCVCLSL